MGPTEVQDPTLKETTRKSAKGGVPTVLGKLKKWGDYESFGAPTDMLLPMKTPLTERIIRDWSATLVEAPKHLHTVGGFIEAQRKAGRRVGLIVDLCNHECLYQDETPSSVAYEHIWCIAKEVPGDEDIQQFVTTVDNFRRKYPKKYVAVHCSYGFNRTGFMICCYLIQKLKLSIADALQRFKDSRSPGIKHEKFKKELTKRYGQNSENDSGQEVSLEEKRHMEESLISLDVESGQELLRKLEECKRVESTGKVMTRTGSQDSMPSISSLDSVHSLVASSLEDEMIMIQHSTKKSRKGKRCAIM